MKQKHSARLVVAILITVLAAVFLSLWLYTRRPAPPPPPPPPPVEPIEPGATMKPPIMVINRADTEAALGSRLLCDSAPQSRFGPGYDYPVIPGSRMQRGQRVYIMESAGIWIRVRLQEQPGPGAGWINKYSSMPEMHLSRDILTFSDEVKHLKDIGLVIEVQAEDNNVLVETNQWAQLTSDVRGGVGRSLAYYCGLKRGVNTRWVDLSDSVSGTRLARFSDNTGYSEYSTLRKPKK